MRVFVTGQTGFVGKHVVSLLLEQGHELVGIDQRPSAMIHLAWAGLPSYESKDHYDNLEWQADLLARAIDVGVNNLTVAGTCLEEVFDPPPYAMAKKLLHRFLMKEAIILKWVRLPYLHGEGQREGCLLPRLSAAIKAREKQFHVIPTSLPFMHVKDAAARIVSAMTDERAQTMNCPGEMLRVADFCRRHMDEGAIELVEDYPMKPWEK